MHNGITQIQEARQTCVSLESTAASLLHLAGWFSGICVLVVAKVGSFLVPCTFKRSMLSRHGRLSSCLGHTYPESLKSTALLDYIQSEALAGVMHGITLGDISVGAHLLPCSLLLSNSSSSKIKWSSSEKGGMTGAMETIQRHHPKTSCEGHHKIYFDQSRKEGTPRELAA